MSNISVNLIYGLLALFIAQVVGHGHLSTPVSTDLANTDAPVSYPLASDFVCRNAQSGSQLTTITAGQSTTLTWTFSAPHPGDCFAYLSYDIDAPDTKKRWFKIAQFANCVNMNGQPQQLAIPSYLPPCDHCVLRWEWYSLQLQPISIVEFYAQCADVKIVSSNTNGALPSPQVTIPGHIPMDAKFYRNPYSDAPVAFIGPPLATPNGASYDCSSTYDSSCTIAPVSKNPCNISAQRCIAGSSTTYQACQSGATATEWGPAQSCGAGTVCSPSGNRIYCVRPTDVPVSNTPTAPAPAPVVVTPPPVSNPPPISTPATTGMRPSSPKSTTGMRPSSPKSTTGKASGHAKSTTGQAQASGMASTSTSASASDSSSSTCTSGTMKCLTSETYSSCFNSAWSLPRPCNTGLTCKPSGDYIYCV